MLARRLNDQFIGLNRIIITGTIRDSLYLLDLILGNNSEIFENLSKNKLRENLIHKYWDDILRIVASLKLGMVNGVNLIKMLKHSGKQTILGRDIGEIGKVFKTIHQLDYLNDADYRRRILIQLNRGESENSLRRAIMYGKKAEVLNPYKEEQEEQMNILALVTNSIII